MFFVENIIVCLNIIIYAFVFVMYVPYVSRRGDLRIKHYVASKGRSTDKILCCVDIFIFGIVTNSFSEKLKHMKY